jgi:hypothetical protein
MTTRRKSTAYVEAIVREAVVRVLRSVRPPLQDAGYSGPESVLELTDVQQDFLAGYIYGALQRLLELGELGADDDVALATHRLYCSLFGFDDNEFGPWHQWVIRDPSPPAAARISRVLHRPQRCGGADALRGRTQRPRRRVAAPGLYWRAPLRGWMIPASLCG